MSDDALDRTAEVTAFSKAARWTGVRSEDRPAWLAQRKFVLTASDVAAIMGEDKDRCALDVYVEKRRDEVAGERVDIKDPGFWARFIGTVTEQPMLSVVARYHGWKYRAGGALLVSRAHPMLGATIDAEVERGDGVWCDFEGKTTELSGDWDEETGQLPKRVLIQVQTQLLVTKAEVAIVFALLRRNKPVQIPVYPNERFHGVIVEYAEWFMDLVRRGVRPPPDGTEAARRRLHEIFPLDNGAIVDLPPEAIGWTAEYQDVCEQLRELEARKRFLQNQIKAAMGEATYGLLPEDVGEKSCWRWKTQKTETYAVEERESRVLLALKHPPQGARVGAHPPALTPRDTRLEAALAASVLENDNAQVIRFPVKRRRSRR